VPKLKLLILDAGVVIKLHEWELWEQVIAKCDVHLSSIVAGRESKYHQVDGDDWDQDIDLGQAIQDGKITIFEVPPADILAFKNRFDVNYFCDLDDGEAESLAYLTSHAALDFRISSGDAIVYKALGNLNIVEQGISLGEILQQIGLSRRINEFQYTKAFRDQMTTIGSTDRIQGRGLKILDT
jgi:hypothetical protein